MRCNARVGRNVAQHLRCGLQEGLRVGVLGVQRECFTRQVLHVAPPLFVRSRFSLVEESVHAPLDTFAGHRLRLQQPAVPQRPLQRRLHLHVAQLGDSEVEVLDGGVVLVRVVLQQQLGEVEAYEGDLGTEATF